MNMRKTCSSLILTAALLLPTLTSAPSSAGAAPAPKTLVYVDKGNHSYIPLRFLNGFDGIKAGWSAAGDKIEITKDDNVLTLAPGQVGASLNGKATTTTERAFTDNGTLYVPLSVVSKSLGLGLKWDAPSSSITIASGDVSSTLPVLSGALIPAESQGVVAAAKSVKVGSRSFQIQTVTVSLLHPKVRLDMVLAGNTVGKVEDLNSIAKRSGAIAAVNGTFFDAYTKGSYKAPYGYIVSNGKLLKDSPADRRAVFAYDKNYLAGLVAGLDFKARFNAGQVEGAVQAGPRLLLDGKVSLNVAAEGFRDPKILTGGGARSALGLTRDHKLIIVTTGGATIPQMAEIMKQAGAYQAMNLDGGASSGLFYNGKYLTSPGRQISNALIVKYQ
ncbi:phosphodiester glycosidase family protein [Paenibacillus agri]|nr:phosphodiester glycosidase family protein [Paenibacillus agri]